MLTEWRRWCRLCAKDEGDEVNVFGKNENSLNIAEVIQKYFSIAVTSYDEIPTTICSSCYYFISNLVNFAERCSKVESLFNEIIFEKHNLPTIDIGYLRYQFGINGFDNLSTNARKKDQCTDTNDLLVEFIPMPEEDEDDPAGEESQTVTVTVVNTNGTEYQLRTKKIRKKPPEDEDEELSYKSAVTSSVHEAEPLRIESAELDTDNEQENEDYLDEDFIVDVKTEIDEDDTEEVVPSPCKKKRGRKPGDTSKPFKCRICEKTFARENTFKYHEQNCENSISSLCYPCSHCGKNFPTERRAGLHEATHLPPELKTLFPCGFCGKKFTKAVNVQAHVKAIHIGEKPFICEECGKAFGTKGALKEHKYTHIDETPFQCTRCPKRFKNMARLKTHEDTHTDTAYICPHCGTQLNTKRTLQMHMVVHSDQKKYKCNYCGNEYKRSKSLKNHLILHTGLRPYTCPFCDKTFANGSNCRSHKKKAHPLELAAMEAAGERPPALNIPKLEQLKAVTVQQILPSETKTLILDESDKGILPSMTYAAIYQEAPSLSSHSLEDQLNGTQSSLISSQDDMNQPQQEHEQHDFAPNMFEQVECPLNAVSSQALS